MRNTRLPPEDAPHLDSRPMCTFNGLGSRAPEQESHIQENPGWGEMRRERQRQYLPIVHSRGRNEFGRTTTPPKCSQSNSHGKSTHGIDPLQVWMAPSSMDGILLARQYTTAYPDAMPCRSGKTPHLGRSIPGAMCSCPYPKVRRRGSMIVSERSILPSLAPPRFLT